MGDNIEELKKKELEANKDSLNELIFWVKVLLSCSVVSFFIVILTSLIR